MESLFDLLLSLTGIFMFIWLLISMYFRFAKKKPLKFEHALVKILLINKEVGRTRLFKNKDTITIGMTMLPWALKYPTYSKVITAFFITTIILLFLHSLTILMHVQKHRASEWTARISLLITLGLGCWTLVEFLRVI
jgi:hypothetical protein